MTSQRSVALYLHLLSSLQVPERVLKKSTRGTKKEEVQGVQEVPREENEHWSLDGVEGKNKNNDYTDFVVYFHDGLLW